MTGEHCDCDWPADVPGIDHRPWCVTVTGFHAEPEMTEMDIAAIKARADAATPGPWSLFGGWVVAGAVYGLRIVGDGEVPVLVPTLEDADLTAAAADFEFIAHARTDVPALLARIAELEAQRDELLAYPPKMLKGELAAAERRGYLRAVARLRDREAWAKWCAARIAWEGVQTIDIRQPTDAADYLDAVKEEGK